MLLNFYPILVSCLKIWQLDEHRSGFLLNKLNGIRINCCIMDYNLVIPRFEFELIVGVAQRSGYRPRGWVLVFLWLRYVIPDIDYKIVSEFNDGHRSG